MINITREENPKLAPIISKIIEIFEEDDDVSEMLEAVSKIFTLFLECIRNDDDEMSEDDRRSIVLAYLTLHLCDLRDAMPDEFEAIVVRMVREEYIRR